MKTIKNNKLDFRKSSITELNDKNLYDVNGGTSPIISLISRVATKSSLKCSAAISISLTWPGEPLE